MMHPEIMLPTRFFGQLHGRAALQRGECRLLVAVLDDAVRRFQKYADASNLRGQRLFIKVEQWITDRGAGGEPSLSFEYICAVLGLDPDYVREGLRRWRQGRMFSFLGPNTPVNDSTATLTPQPVAGALLLPSFSRLAGPPS